MNQLLLNTTTTKNKKTTTTTKSFTLVNNRPLHYVIKVYFFSLSLNDDAWLLSLLGEFYFPIKWKNLVIKQPKHLPWYKEESSCFRSCVILFMAAENAAQSIHKQAVIIFMNLDWMSDHNFKLVEQIILSWKFLWIDAGNWLSWRRW
jgi:hypothetical protein